MKQKLLSLICLLLALLAFLPSCASTLTTTEEKKETETVASADTVVTENGTEPQDEDEQKTEESASIMQKEDPALDDTFTVLMIGNSFSSFFVDELYEMGKLAGIKMRLCRVYYSGCTVNQHWEWFRNGAANYKYYIYDEKGKRSKSNFSLKDALRQENWDVITLQTTGGTLNTSIEETGKIESTIKKAGAAAKNLYDYLKEQFPSSAFYWHETWAFEVGYDRSNGKIPDKAAQDNMRLVTQAIQRPIAAENNAGIIPTGDAWYLARQNAIVGDTLCVGSDKNNGLGDHYHDGDSGGGQYLNACVWFEVLTGKSCVGNTWRPSYDLDGAKTPVLQQAAHAAVAAIYGENYAK